MEYKYNIEPIDKPQGFIVAVDEEEELPRAVGELVFKAIEAGILPTTIVFEVDNNFKWVISLWGEG